MAVIIASLKNHIAIVIISVLFVGAGLLRMNDLSLYSPDSTRYMIWGNSLAQGKGFLDSTQPDPDRTVVHAPLYSILIVPIEYFFPLSHTAVKIWTLCFGVLALVLLYLYLNRSVGTKLAVVGTILFACNPLVLIYSTEVLSEAPFVASVLFILLMVNRLSSGDGSKMLFGVLCFTLAVVPILREVGTALVIAVAAHFVLRKQWGRAFVIVLCVLIVVCLWYFRNHVLIGFAPGSQADNLSMVFEHIVTPPDAPLVNEFALRMWLNFKEYFLKLGGMLLYPQFATHQLNIAVHGTSVNEALRLIFSYGKVIVVLVGIPLMVLGVYRDVKDSSTASVRALFCILYLTSVFVYPIHDIRFLAPLLPMMIYYCIRSVQWYLSRREGTASTTMLRYSPVVAIIFMLPNLYSVQSILKTNIAYKESPSEFYKQISRLSTYPAIFGQPWSLMGKWIQENLPSEVTIASPAKDLAVVIGERKLLELNPGVPLPTFEMLLRDHGVDYMLAPIRWQDMKVYELLMTESARFWFEPVYRVSNLVLLKIHSRFREHSAERPSSNDTSQAFVISSLLRKGRQELINEQYESASQTLTQAVTLDPFTAEVVYHCMISYAMMGDQKNASVYFQRLLTLPQAGTFIPLARHHMRLMELSNALKSVRAPEELAVKTFDVAQNYWKLGYYKRAQSLMNGVLSKDSTYFNGLLWGFHFNYQLGDTAYAQVYLRHLQQIDSVNPIVQAFSAFIQYDRILSATHDDSVRSAIHLSKAELYKKIDLKEEALDEAERALHANPQNTDAMVFMSLMYELKGRLRTAKLSYQRVLTLQQQNSFAQAKIDSINVQLKAQ